MGDRKKMMQNYLNDWKVQDIRLEAFKVGVTNDSLLGCYTM
jgi:hypothetical protein